MFDDRKTFLFPPDNIPVKIKDNELNKRYGYVGRVPNPKYARNKNILVIGGSGSGKTRFFIKPNLMLKK